MRVVKSIMLFLLAVTFIQGQGKNENIKKITLQEIYTEHQFTQRSFGPSKWLNSGKGYTTLETSETTSSGKDIVKYNSETGERTILVPADKLIPQGKIFPMNLDNYDWSPDGKELLLFTNTKKVWRENTRGDYWILNLDDWSLRKLGGPAKPSTLMFAEFSPDGQSVAYVRENNIYVEKINSGIIKQMTFDGSETIINGTFDWVYEEELKQQDGFRWSPDGNAIAFWQLDASGVGVFNMINYTDSIYSKVIPIQYPKVGQQNSAAKIGVISLKNNEITWMKIEGDPRNNYLARMDWADNSDELFVQQLNRKQNTNNVLICNAGTGDIRKVFTEKDDAWLRANDGIKWFDNSSEFTWLSERDGWNHMYAVSRADGSARLITKGEYDVISVENIDLNNGFIYFIASPEDPTRRYLFRIPLDGSEEPERLTPIEDKGDNSYKISPNSEYAIHTYSAFNIANRINFISLPNHKVLRSLETNEDITKRIAEHGFDAPEFFRVKIEEGVELDGWCLKPHDFDPSKKYPVLFFVYGEPAGQTVRDRWRWDRNMWHEMLAQEGYVVMSLDNRGTPAPRGREWRKSIYRKIGVLSSHDQAAGLKALIKENNWIDESRIGIWGWSGGGSMTLNMLFRYPDLYHVGMSVAPVGDQRLYDNIYQERYMGLLWENEKDFIEGSPVTYAKNLKGKLLLVHGTGDDNVHYQNSEIIINELIKNEKQFQMFAYPNRTHSIGKTSHDRRHLFEMMTEFLKKNLLSGGI